ncbi:cytochrome c3 family protein [Chloroflexota bacterium]
MIDKIRRLLAALIIIGTVASSIAVASTAIAADGGVKQASVSLSLPEVLPDGSTNVTITVVSGSSTDSWSGNITVTDPGANSRTVAISGTGTESTTKLFPDDFSAGSNTASVGTYSITAYANIAGQTAVTGNSSFAVKTWYIEVGTNPIVTSANITFTIRTNDTSWAGTVNVTEPAAGGPDTSTYTFGTLSGNQSTTAFPTGAGWVGSANTVTVGTYTVSFDEGSDGADDTATFDVQDASPHVGTGFGQTTYACAGCHRTHVGATAAKLLKSSTQLALCESCHSGTGANTNVIDGTYLGETQGTQNGGLRGGGFTNAYMDTDLDGSMTSTGVNSKHTVGSTNPVAWGSGSINTSSYSGEVISSLECGNCHNPHGNDQYRLLRPAPTGLVTDAAVGDVTISSALETAKIFTIGYDSNYYRDLGAYPTGVLSQMTEWCGQCHARYEASVGSGSTNSTDAIFKYRHMTEGIGGECLKCHVAHGTSASMSQNAASATITWPGSTDPSAWQDVDSEDDYSRLLHIDNRGVCMQCHDTTELTGN